MKFTCFTLTVSVMSLAVAITNAIWMLSYARP